MNISKPVIKKLSRVLWTCAVLFLTLTSAPAVSNEKHLSAKTNGGLAPSAKFDSIWVDYDVTEDDRKGMRIHLKFTTYELKGIDSSIRIYFQTSDGTNLKDKNQKFYSAAGNVAVFNDIKPGYEPAFYEDLKTFMPYDELELNDGKYNLRMDVDLIYEDGTLIQHLTYKEFVYSQTPDETETKGPSGTVKKVWVEKDVTEDGRKGVRVHVNFEVVGLKDVDSKVVARVQKPDGTYLPSNTSYANKDGQLETSYDLKPGYATTVYEDASLFLPDGEINLLKGVWALKLDIDLNYENGKLIQHLAYENFEYISTGENEESGKSSRGGDTPVKTNTSQTLLKNGVKATVKRIWIEQNVLQNGRKGIRIHVNFEVTGLKFVESKLVVRVRKEDDEYLASSSKYANRDGELEVALPIKPVLATAVYKDASLFLPASEIILRKGVWNLKLDIDIAYADGELIQHLDFYDFEFTK